jgi:ELMO/CED-12 family
MGEGVLNEIADKDMKDQRWTKYGFQNSNPRTDFRGAGILGVKNLTYFAQNHSEVSLNNSLNSIAYSKNDIKSNVLHGSPVNSTFSKTLTYLNSFD